MVGHVLLMKELAKDHHALFEAADAFTGLNSHRRMFERLCGPCVIGPTQTDHQPGPTI
jgi:hypothetical protein